MAPRSAFTARRAGYMLLGAAVLSASLLARSLMAPDTHAAVGGCRSDPVVTLSNGHALDLSRRVRGRDLDSEMELGRIARVPGADLGDRIESVPP